MNRLVLLGVILILSCILIYLSTKGSLEHFGNPLTPLIQQNQPYYNEASDLINQINPQIALSPTTTQDFIKATIAADYDSSITPGTTKPLRIPSEQPPNVKVAQTICETVNTANCDAFDNKDFAANCGIALDIGTNSKEKPHTGGLYISANMRQSQKLNKLIINGKDYNTYTPTLGKSKNFAVDKNSCLRKQVDLRCKQGHVIGQGNSVATCSLCFSDGSYHATEPNSNPGPIKLFIITNMDNGQNPSLTVTVGSNTQKLKYNGSQGDSNIFESPPLQAKEGDNITIKALQSNKTDIYVAGWIQGPKPTWGPYRIDLMAFISQDYSQPPLMEGTALSYFKFIQQPGYNGLQLSGIIPFTFTMPPNPDADNCPNGPFVTQAASMVALNADGDCYDPANGPGNYPTACLQKVFRGVGGTTKGTGYPTDANPNSTLKLLYDSNGNPRTLSQITDYLSDFAVQAATGLNNGVSMTISEWNQASMYMTGRPITNPCETAGNGPITAACLNYLYTDPGTYGNSVNSHQSLNSNNFQQSLVCRPEGALNPSKPNGLAKGKAAAATGGKAAVIRMYKQAYQTANDSNLSNNNRKQAFKDCYGGKILQSKPEVYRAFSSSSNTYNDGPQTCAKLGAQMATLDQLKASHKAGAQTCGCGYTATDQKPRFPMQEGGVAGCWGDANNLSNCEMDKSSAVWCYGPKPDADSVPSGVTVQPFVTTPSPNVPGRWSQYD